MPRLPQPGEHVCWSLSNIGQSERKCRFVGGVGIAAYDGEQIEELLACKIRLSPPDIHQIDRDCPAIATDYIRCVLSTVIFVALAFAQLNLLAVLDIGQYRCTVQPSRTRTSDLLHRDTSSRSTVPETLVD